MSRDRVQSQLQKIKDRAETVLYTRFRSAVYPYNALL